MTHDTLNLSSNATEVQAAAAIKDLSKQKGDIPKLIEIVEKTREIRGGHLSSGALYHVFARYGEGRINDFARAHGVHPAVIVDGSVYSSYLHEMDLVEGAEGGISLHEESELLRADPEATTAALEAMPTSQLIGMLGDIAIILKQRSEPIV